METKISIVADEQAVNPHINLMIAASMSQPEIRRRSDLWDAQTAELLLPLTQREPVPAAIAVSNLTKALNETASEIQSVQAQLAGNAHRLANAAADGKNLDEIEKTSSTLSARLVSLQARQPALQAKLRDAKADRSREEGQADAVARLDLLDKLRTEAWSLANSIIPAGLFDEGGSMDKLAALQNALARLSR